VRDQAVTREAFNQALIAFITTLVRQRTGSTAKTLTEIDEFTPLFETGLIDSMGILDLLAFVEERTGGRIPIQKVDLRFFGTVDRISRSFWGHDEEDDHGPAISTIGTHKSRA
jgi:hypothetical protein